MIDGVRFLINPGESNQIVTIDIKPVGKFTAENQPNKAGVPAKKAGVPAKEAGVPVVIFGSAYLDVNSIEINSLALEGYGVMMDEQHNNMAIIDFVNDDPYPDLVVNFENTAGSFPGADQSKVSPQGMTLQSSGGSTRAIVSFTGIKVEKSTAQNGYTVGELFAKAVNLNNQKVTVKGRVVKISPNIMGKNWIHIQDGTGDQTKNTHDLVVTSSAIVEKGTIVSLEGVLAAGKDFGSGYRYDVLIEDAVVVK